MAKYDFVIVGSGIFGLTYAYEANKLGYSTIILEKHNKIGGNLQTKVIEGIECHLFGSHTFHTNSEKIIKFVTDICPFQQINYNCLALTEIGYLPLPVNYLTYQNIFKETNYHKLISLINSDRISNPNPTNAEEWLLCNVGKRAYELIYRDYTFKHWGKEPKDLPSSIVNRLPYYLYNNSNYFNAAYVGLPKLGWGNFLATMSERCGKIEVGTDGRDWAKYGKRLIWTGPIDEFYDYCFGPLEYRGLEFDWKTFDGQYQPSLAINHCTMENSFVRSIEHKLFNPSRRLEKTVVSFEYPTSTIKQYPVNDTMNNLLYKKYKDIPNNKVYFGGRLGSYKYLNIDQTIASALSLTNELCNFHNLST